MSAFATWLEHSGAQRDVVSWARDAGLDWKDGWATCPRGDWMLAIGARIGVDRSALVRAAVGCAKIAIGTAGEEAARLDAMLAAALDWARAHGPTNACDDAGDSAERAASESQDAVFAAAAHAVAAASRTAADPTRATMAAAQAAEAAVLDAGDCAMMEALRYAHAKTADEVRKHIPFTLVEAAKRV